MNYFKFHIHNVTFQKYTIMNMVKPQFLVLWDHLEWYKLWGSAKSGKHSLQKVH